MKWRVFIYLLCLLLTFNLTGCWNSRELDTLGIVQAIGIDQAEDGQISLTLQILKPATIKPSSEGDKGGGGGGDENVMVVTATGQTLFDAIRNATYQVSRRSFFSQNNVIVIGEEAAKSGIAPLLDLTVRDPELRLLTYVFIAKGKAKDILEAQHKQEKFPAKALENMAITAPATSKSPQTRLLEVTKSLVSKTNDPFVAGIESMELLNGGSEKKQVKHSGTAVFKEDKLIGWFNEKETRGLLWVLGEVKSGVIVVASPKDESKKAVLEIIRASSKVIPEFVEGNLTVTIAVKAEGNLSEQMSPINLTQPETFKELEAKQAVAIKDEITAAVNKAQSWGVDIFKFGTEVHRKFPGEYTELKDNWEEEFRNIVVNIEVESKLSRVGLTTEPINTEDE